MSMLLSDADVRQAVNYTELADGIEAALKVQTEEAAVVPARMNLEHFGTWLRVMPAIVPSANVMGLKVFHGVPGGGARYLVLLYSVTDGSVLAAVDASYLTAARTAATSAVAARYLSPQGPVRLGVIGLANGRRLRRKVFWVWIGRRWLGIWIGHRPFIVARELPKLNQWRTPKLTPKRPRRP